MITVGDSALVRFYVEMILKTVSEGATYEQIKREVVRVIDEEIKLERS